MASHVRNSLLFLLCFSLTWFFPPPLCGIDKKQPEISQPEISLIPPSNQPGYTINFNNVSITEYLKFISKAGQVNFVYNEEELKFNVTIISEEPTRFTNIMGALIQVLRINGFDIIEQGNNLIITKIGAVKQIATVVSKEAPLQGKTVPVIMTRVFKVKNSNPTYLANILKPLLSKEALLEISTKTRHLIITDTTQNIEQIQRLLLTLDAPKMSLEIDVYIAKNNSPSSVTALANKILSPIAEGNPLILVPQNHTNSIFIVSTPFLIGKALTVLEDLDSSPSLTKKLIGPVTGKNILIYHAKNMSANALQNAVYELEATLRQKGPTTQSLIETLKSMKQVQDSHSLLFIGSPESLSEIEVILKSLDVPHPKEELGQNRGGFYIYKIKYTKKEQIARSLETFVTTLKKSAYPDQDLIKTIASMKWIKENNSLLFTGDEPAIEKLKNILIVFDTPSDAEKKKSPLSSDFYVYKPKYQSGKALLKKVQDISKNLKNAGLVDPAFLRTLSSVKWTPSSQSLVFTGDPQSLERIRMLIEVMDHAIKEPDKGVEKESAVFLYKVKFANPSHINQGLHKLAQSLPAKTPLAQIIDKANYIEESKSFIFRGPPASIEQIKEILLTLDTQAPSQELTKKNTFYIYTPTYHTPEFIVKQAKYTASTMQKSGLADPQLIQALKSGSIVSKQTAVLFTGTSNAITKIQAVLPSLDTPGEGEDKEGGKPVVFVYKIQHTSPPILIKSLQDIANDLVRTGSKESALSRALNKMRYIKQTNSLIFTGAPEGVEKARELAAKFDVATSAPKNTFYIYKPTHHTPAFIIKQARQTASKMQSSGLADPQLIQALESGSIVSEETAVLFTGTTSAIDRLKNLVVSFEAKEATSTELFVYKPLHLLAKELLRHIHMVANDMEKTGFSNLQLIQTLQDAHLVSEGHSLFFTGTPDAIATVKDLLPSLDTPGEQERKEGVEPTFFIYKIQYTSPPALMQALKSTGSDLMRAGSKDQALTATLNGMRYIKETNSIIFTGTPQAIEKVKALAEKFDTEASAQTSTFYIYKPTHHTPEFIIKQAKHTASTMQNSGLADPQLIQTLESASIVSEKTAVLFTGTPQAVEKAKALSEKFDAETSAQTSTFYIYKPTHHTPEFIIKQAKHTASTMKNSGLVDPQLIQALESASIVSEKTAVLFTGTTPAIDRIKQLVPSFETQGVSATELFVYKPLHISAKDLLRHAHMVANDMEKAGFTSLYLIETLKGARLVSEGQSLLFTGTPDSIGKVKDLLPSLDTPGDKQLQESLKTNFLIYKIKYIAASSLMESLQNMGKDLAHAGSTNQAFANTLNTARYIEKTNSIIFTGTSQAIKQAKALTEKFDIPELAQGTSTKASTGFLIYKPHSVPGKELLQILNDFKKSLIASQVSEKGLFDTISRLHWTEKTSTILISGDEESRKQVLALLERFDVPTSDTTQKSTKGAGAMQANTFYIYKTTQHTPKFIIKQAKHTASEMRISGLADPHLIQALESGTIVSQNTAVLFTGTESAIEHLKEIVHAFDVKETGATEFFVYKSIHISTNDLLRHIHMVAKDMENSGLADLYLIQTLASARLVSQGSSLLFTGTPDAIAKVKELLPSLDLPGEGSIKQVAETIFLIYKIQHATPSILMEYLKNMGNDFALAGSKDSGLINTLNNMRYVKETNSLIFTGTAQAVDNAKALAEKFDTPGLKQGAPTRTPKGFLIYQPKHVGGEELIRILHDFEQNLTVSGVNKQELFDVIRHLRWIAKTSTILISGGEASSQEVLALLERFDVPGAAESASSIESLSDTNFFIYKLQYHSGPEIQGVVKRIGNDLKQSKGSKSLVDAIRTLQYIEVTNSLVSTGNAKGLSQLKELITSIDSPLQQVFVEILVIETTLSNALNFGLRWGSQGTYRDKFSYGGGVFPVNTTDRPDNLRAFNSSLSTINATTTPTGSMVPFSPGGDLGIIGDIILHKGRSYFALGALLDALKTDGNTTIIMNQKIITQDNKNSTFFTGQNVPYTGSLVTNVAANTTQTTNLEYRDVGVNLSITPTVGDHGVITLAIKQDISEQVNPGGEFATLTTNVSGITTNKTQTQTVVTVPDKSFLVLSGQMENSSTLNRTSLPCLGGLPIIGAAFSNLEKNESSSNIIIFIRPQIIKSFDVYKEITNKQEDQYRNQADAENFDAGLELVKTPDDA